MMDATRIIVVRHGETDWNTVKRIQGHIDIPLNARGRWQAEQAGRTLAGQEVDAVYSSDLQRAWNTAEAIGRACGLSVQAHVPLRERCFGSLEGQTFAEVEVSWPEAAALWRHRDPDFCPPKGESIRTFYDRCVGALHTLAQRHAGQQIVVVAHGGVLDCYYRAAMGLHLQAPRTWEIANASLNRLLWTPAVLTLVGWADVQHLQDSAALDESAA
jgi:probable phosphoglycerate mutase